MTSIGLNSNIVEIPISDPQYPESLRSIINPPQILYAKGNLDLLSYKPGVSIVGTRKASKNGIEIAKRLARFAVEQNQVVVSGLALGIDAAAHEGCLNAGGKTIAVLASGLHIATPKKNEYLAQRILDSGGLWVSEHPEGVNPQPKYFVPRNRIQVGLSTCSIIVESEKSSGTTTHAKFCKQENHPLFAVIPVDGNPLRLVSSGPEMMVRDFGAKPLKSKRDYSSLLDVFN